MNTPRTDAFISKFYGNRSLSSGSRHRTDVELHDFARQLERELAAALAEIAALREFAKHLLVVHDHTEPLVAAYIVDEVLRECGK